MLLCGTWLLMNGSYTVVAAAAGVVAVITARRYRRARAIRRAGLRARADFEHRLAWPATRAASSAAIRPCSRAGSPIRKTVLQMRYFDGALWTPYAGRARTRFRPLRAVVHAVGRAAPAAAGCAPGSRTSGASAGIRPMRGPSPARARGCILARFGSS